MLELGYFDCYLHLCPLASPNLESNFLKVLEVVVTSDREHIFIQLIKLLISTDSNNSKNSGLTQSLYIIHIGILLEIVSDGQVDFLDGAREQGHTPEDNLLLVY